MNAPLAGALRNWPWRRVFLRSRLLVLLLLLLSAVWLYLNQAGLPRFITTRIEAQFRSAGIDLHIGRIRWRGFRSLIAENLRSRNAARSNRPDIVIETAEARLDAKALWRFQIQMETLVVRHGQLILPILSSNAPPAELPFEEVNLELRFSPNGQWTLRTLQARCRNLEVRASGSVTSALALRKKPSTKTLRPPQLQWQERLHELATHFQKTSLSAPSVLQLEFHGDGRDPSTFQATLSLQTPQAATPWGTVENFQLGINLSPGDTASPSLNIRCQIQASTAQTAAGQFRNVTITGQFASSITNLKAIQGTWQFEAQDARSRWGNADRFNLAGTLMPPSELSKGSPLQLTAQAHGVRGSEGTAQVALLSAELNQPSIHLAALTGRWKAELQRAESRWGKAELVRFSGTIRPSPPDRGQGPAQASWGWWQKLEPLDMDWEGRLSQVTSANLEIDAIDCAGEWQAPELVIHKFHTQLYEGQIDLNANLNVPRRELRSQFTFDFDILRMAPLLATNSQQWLRQFSWRQPPHVAAEAQILLPSWTNREPNQLGEALKTLTLSGALAAGPGEYQGVAVSSASAHFSFSNAIWRLPDLVIRRPEGMVELDGREDTATREFFWTIRSQIEPKALKPLLEAAPQRVLDFFEFTEPPLVQGHIRGQWHRPEGVGFSVQVTATNFTFRGERFDDFHAAAHFTNQFVNFNDVKIRRGPHQITASNVGYDVEAGLIHVTNGVSTMDPDLVTKVIGPNVRAAISPYHFKEPPTVLVDGQLPTRSEADADAHFRIKGQSFNFWRFNVPQISGHVHWRGETVAISGLQAGFYNGQLDWSGKFDFSGPPGARFQFQGRVAQANLQSLVADLTLTNTPLEGILGGNLIVTSADTRDWLTWQGSGDVQLRDGFLWNVPSFGFFSPILNKIVPGFGQSRVSAGSATYEFDHGLIRTSDLEMKAPALRLQYVGAVSFQGRVDARVQADIFRDAWAVGRVLSLALWPVTKVFEYKVTGTLNEPKSELLNFPKFLIWPFHPLKTIKAIFSPDEPVIGGSPLRKSDSTGKR